jgi:glycerol-3-phosphate acyltransferase PlsY
VRVGALDVGKGFRALWLAQRHGLMPWAPGVAAGLVVIGHCWPVFARFRGGMGMASGAGAMLAVWPLGFVLGVGLAALSQLLLRHSARGNALTGILVAPLWALFGAPGPALAVAAAAGLVVTLRALSDWNRVYRELWLDRE